MNISKDQQLRMNACFEKAKPRLLGLIGRFIADARPVWDAAAIKFGKMLPDMVYIGKPDHPLATPYFEVCSELAVYLALKDHHISVHDFGCALLTTLAQSAVKPRNMAADPVGMANLIACGKDSKKHAASGEVVFEAFLGDHENDDWGIIFKTCATCTIFARYGAADLVPYMCAKADVLSDKGKLGLKRSGTIALGARKCEYRYKSSGKPQRLSDQYPNRIHYRGNN